MQDRGGGWLEFRETRNRQRFYHTGEDMRSRNTADRNVYAAADGRIVRTSNLDEKGWALIIEHDGFWAEYTHITPISGLVPNRPGILSDPVWVTVGQQIWHIHRNYTHVHFAIRLSGWSVHQCWWHDGTNGLWPHDIAIRDFVPPTEFINNRQTAIRVMYVSVDVAPVHPQPYAASGEIVSHHFGQIVSILESHHNSHNNLWHRMPGGWIYAGNLSIPTTMYITRDNAPIRPRPYQDYNPERNLNTGSEVQVLRNIINSRNNKWYQLTSGLWVYSGNVSYNRPVATIANDTYRIRSVAAPSRVMGVSTWSLPALNNNVTIFDDVGNGSTQHWRLESRGDAFVLHTSISPLVLNAFRNNYAVAGTNTNVRNYVPGALTQLWAIQNRGNGQFTIASQSNPNLVLTVASTGNSARISTQIFNGNASQLWTFEIVD